MKKIFYIPIVIMLTSAIVLSVPYPTHAQKDILEVCPSPPSKQVFNSMTGAVTENWDAKIKRDPFGAILVVPLIFTIATLGAVILAPLDIPYCLDRYRFE